MEFTMAEAKARLAELVRLAEDGDEIVLTRHGHPVARLLAARQKPDRATKRALMEAISKRASLKAAPGASAARSQDYLYDERGLPG
jgi:prevent-host-death family protein